MPSQSSNHRFLKFPPFHDAHIHFMMEGRQANSNEAGFMAQEFISHGILSVEDMGHHSGSGLELRTTHRKTHGPLKILSAGYALYKKGTYGRFLGKGVSGKKEIVSAIRSLAEAGVDHLKIINSGIVSLRAEHPVTEGGFTLEEWKIIRAEADRHHLKIHCHANSDPSIRQAVTSGVSSIEHGFFISEETLCQMAEKNVSWTPTIIALLSLKSFIPQEVRKYLEEVVDGHLQSLYYGASLGVKLRVGTDSGSKGVKPGSSFIKELQLYKKAGLSSEQIISAACLNREEVDKGTYVLVEKDFIDQERVEAVFIKGIPITNDSPG